MTPLEREALLAEVRRIAAREVSALKARVEALEKQAADHPEIHNVGYRKIRGT